MAREAASAPAPRHQEVRPLRVHQEDSGALPAPGLTAGPEEVDVEGSEQHGVNKEISCVSVEG